MYTDEQRAGIQALLERILQVEKDKGRQIVQIQYSDIARENWAKNLTREQALQLARFELKHGPWIMPRGRLAPPRGRRASRTSASGLWAVRAAATQDPQVHGTRGDR